MKISREYNEFGLELRWKWSRGFMYFVIPFALFWTVGLFWHVGFIDFLLSIRADGFLSSLKEHMEVSDSIPLLFGIGFSYWALTYYFNETIIRVGSSTLSVRHAPMPWPGSTAIDTSTISKLYTKSRVAKGNRGHTFLVYDIVVVDKSGNDRNLISPLRSAKHARYIEKAIKKHLKIKNHRVQDKY